VRAPVCRRARGAARRVKAFRVAYQLRKSPQLADGPRSIN
jgi:hypothetical protein